MPTRPSFARSEKYAIMRLLESDLYAPDHDHPRNKPATADCPASSVWVSPLKWTVVVSGPFDTPGVEVIDPRGQHWRTLSPTTAAEVDRILP
jgi:hypothetical protein